MPQEFYQNFILGVLGGGQLGRMLIKSAIDYNLDVFILDPDEHAPCKNIASHFQIGSLTNFDDVYNFGKHCDVITIEIENVNTEALAKLESEGKKVFPQPRVIELIQNKRTQKQFYKQHNIPTSDFILVEGKKDVYESVHFLPAVYKLGKEGYDGRGVFKIKDVNDIEKGFDAPGLLEQFVEFEKEISVIVARNEKGETKCFPVVELVFNPVYNLVDYLKSPADLNEELIQKAESIARKVIDTLGMVGLLAVEMFVKKDGDILVNEVAPRTHNSGHHSIEGNITSQFEQHLRSILDLPLGATDIILPSAMVNLLGENGHNGLAKYDGLEEVMKLPGVHVHLYGKKFTKPFRKMGHVTILENDKKKLEETINFVKKTLKVIS